MNQIHEFNGFFSFLSNFHSCSVLYEGLLYPTSENAFQAAKLYIPGDPQKTNYLRESAGFTDITPGAAKRIGRVGVTLRTDWETVKDKVMYDILLAKFTQNTALTEDLILTHPAELIEGNTWHDNYWGDCECYNCRFTEGKNTLGKLLMQVRYELTKTK